MKKAYIPGIILGILIIAIGVGLLGNAADLWDFTLFFDGWWTLFIIVPCLIAVFTGDLNFFSVAGLVFGIVLLVRYYIPEDSVVAKFLSWPMFIAVAIIILGITVIKGNLSLGGKRRRIVNVDYDEQDMGDKDEATTVFGGRTYRIAVISDKSTAYSAIFSDVTIDLRGAQIMPGATLRLRVIFGEITVLVDSDVKIETRSGAVFGDIKNPTETRVTDKVISADGSVTFGSLEII